LRNRQLNTLLDQKQGDLLVSTSNELKFDSYQLLNMSFHDNNIPDNDYIFFPIEEDDDMCRAIHSLIQVKNVKSDILIQNQTLGPASLPRNAPIGFLYLLTNIEDIKEPPKTELKPDWLKKIHLSAPQEYNPRYQALFQKYRDVFSQDEFDLGWTDTVKHSIQLRNNNPIFIKQFCIPFAHQKVINNFVDDMLNKGLIESTRSKYNSPIFCIQKKNGTW